MIDAKQYCCYILENGRSTYVGITNNRVKRLRQHNSEISGGAKYTSSREDYINAIRVGNKTRTPCQCFWYY